MGEVFDRLTDMSSLLAGFDKVEENQGGPGCDGQTIEDFALDLEGNLGRLQSRLQKGTYEPAPLLRVFMPKENGEWRPLSIPTVGERVAQSSAAQVLDPLLDPEFNDCSFAYRRGRSVDQAVRRIMALRDEGYRWVVDADIDAYFDNIPRDRLLRVLATYVPDRRLLELIGKWLECEIIYEGKLYRVLKGVPQGSPISPLLSNLYLDRFDDTFRADGHRLVRFADDFVILCRSRPRAECALELSTEMLERLRLELNQDETAITSFKDGFRFLGVQFFGGLAFRPIEASAAGPGGVPDQGVQMERELRAGLIEPVREDRERPAQTVMAQALKEALAKPIQVKPAFSQSGQPQKAEGEPEADDPEEEWAPVSPAYEPLLRTLYLVRQGTELGREQRRLVVRNGDEAILEVPAIKLDQIIVFGNVQLTTQAMQLCLKEDIPIFLFSSRGRYYGVVESMRATRVVLQREQFRGASDEELALQLARQFIRGKIANCRTLLLRQLRRLDCDRVGEAAKAMSRCLQQIDRASTLNQLRGFEGSASVSYFGAWRRLLAPEWQFEGRIKRPPPDPVNCLLSYGYTLLFYNVYSLIRAQGLHPYVGFAHSMRQGHPALVSDLVEEFRAPIVDSLVLALINRGQVRPADFARGGDAALPCRLGPDARKSFLRGFEGALSRRVRHPNSGKRCDYRRVIALQAARIAASVKSGKCAYRPFLLR
ncbi:MAG: CRISPR-associated endonuclease Cas1 [Acidobacteriota bacterium]